MLVGHAVWETFRPTFNKHRLWLVGFFFFFSKRFWNGSWLFAHQGERPTFFSEDSGWTRSEKWQVCSGRLIRAEARLYIVLRSKYTTSIRREHTERWHFPHHNPESMVRQPSVWQLSLGAFFLSFLDLMTADFQLYFREQISTWIKGIHRGSQNITLANSFKHKIYLGMATHYEFKESNLNISTQYPPSLR